MTAKEGNGCIAPSHRLKTFLNKCDYGNNIGQVPIVDIFKAEFSSVLSNIALKLSW
jgi:hypothetical protein